MSDINELLAALKSNLGSAEEIIETQSLLEKRKDLQEQFKQSHQKTIYKLLIQVHVSTIHLNIKQQHIQKNPLNLKQ